MTRTMHNLLVIFNAQQSELAQFRRPELEVVTGARLVPDDPLNRQSHLYPAAVAQFTSIECARGTASNCTLVRCVLQPIASGSPADVAAALPYSQRTTLHTEILDLRSNLDKPTATRKAE
eukprot:5342934-Pyramimonas_sp.AAC.2